MRLLCPDCFWAFKAAKWFQNQASKKRVPMRAYHRFSALLLFMLGISMNTPMQAHAQDMFVRPNNQAAHPVDLGIAVKPAPAQPATTQKATPPSQQQPAPQQAGQRPAPSSVQQAQPAPQPAPVQKQPNFVPPQPDGTLQVVTVNQPPVVIPPGSGANTFSVGLQPAAIGQMEVNALYKQLGLSPQEIVANCTFENMVVLAMGERNGSALNMGRTTSAQQRFSMPLTEVNVLPTLACKKIKPPVSGTVIDQGGFYKISAGSVSCPPTHGGSIALSFKYLGNGKGECSYQ